jgi:hypothetical protein
MVGEGFTHGNSGVDERTFATLSHLPEILPASTVYLPLDGLEAISSTI